MAKHPPNAHPKAPVTGKGQVDKIPPTSGGPSPAKPVTGKG